MAEDMCTLLSIWFLQHVTTTLSYVWFIGDPIQAIWSLVPQCCVTMQLCSVQGWAKIIWSRRSFQSRSVDLKRIRKAARDAKFEFNEIQINLRVKTEVLHSSKSFSSFICIINLDQTSKKSKMQCSGMALKIMQHRMPPPPCCRQIKQLLL